MKRASLLAAFAVAAALAASPGATAAEKAAQQAEIRKAAASALEKFYKAQPRIRAEVKAAPGYAVFTTYGLSFVFGGSGGGGLAHDAASGHDSFMKMAQATAGIQAGAAQKDMLIVFKTREAFAGFVEKGWSFGGEGSASAGVAGHTAGAGGGKHEINEAITYTLTRNGLDVGAALAGMKFWKDKELD